MRHCLARASLCALFLPIAVACAQGGAAAPNVAAKAAAAVEPTFSQEPVVLRDARLVVQYHADGTGTRTESQSFLVQSEAAVRNLGVVSLLYASASDTADFVYLRVRHPDGSTVDTPLTDVQEQTPPVTQQAPSYSDLRLKQLPVRGLRVGDTVEWQTRSTTTKPQAPNQFWGSVPFVRNAVTLNQQVELRVPAGLHVTVWTNPADHLAPQRVAEGQEDVYRWQWRSLKPTVGKEAEDATKARESKPLTPEEELDETEGRLPDIAYTTFPDWAAVGAWYRGLLADRVQPDAAIRAKVAEITAHSATEADKVRAVYDFVASNIRYVGVSLGVGWYQPHAASAVLQNQYGDCKDKHTLLAAMLSVLGVQPDAVLIGAGIRFNPAVPYPGAFNHLMTRLPLDGKPVWVDTTSEVAAFRVLTPPTRDKDALVVPLTGTASIQRTPAGYPFAPYNSMEVKGSLNKELTSDSEVVYTLHDDYELGLRIGLRQLSPAQYPEGIQHMMQFYGFGGTTSDPVVENLNNQEKPLIIRFHYHREHGEDWGKDRITTIFGPTGVPMVDDKKPPNSSIQLGVPHIGTSTVDMQLPEGWTAELPEAVHQQMPEVRIDTTYRLDGRTLHAERKTTVLTEKIPARDWPEYHAWYSKANAGDVPYVQLVAPGSHSASGPMLSEVQLAVPTPQAAAKPKPKTQAERMAEAARLVGSASDKLRENDVDGAEQDLKAAQELNPNQEALWGDLGVVAARRQDQTEAMKDYRKEIELYPKSDFAWRNILEMQMQTNFSAAAATAREWAAASPDVLEPRASLLRALWAAEKNTDALTAAKEAAAALPGQVRESNEFQLLLGEAQVRGGQPTAGAETLSHLIQGDSTPAQQNDADYELAKAKQQLPVAERIQREVLNKVGAETLAWTGNESPQTIGQVSSLLTAAWDTMGWILYQEGKFAEAEGYVQAAWRNRPKPEVGEHLGDILAALHRTADADRAYALAEFVGHNAVGVAGSLTTKVTAGKDRIGEEMGRTTRAELLKAQRTFPLPGVTDLKGEAIFALLFTRDSVVSAKPTTGGATHEQEAAVRQAKLAALFPPGESAAILQPVALNCKDKACSVELLP